MEFVSAHLSKVGGRETNQDYCDSRVLHDSGLWIVADGLGGHRGGEVASETAVKAILNVWQPDALLVSQTIKDLILSTQAAILLQQGANPQLSSMRTTLVVLQATSNRVLWGHVGDSRLYLFQESTVAFQTKDHSVSQAMVDAGEITKDQIRSHVDRNRILRAVGNPDGVNPTILDLPRKVKDGDAFLLCTDGFWEYVTETEMAVDLAKSATPMEWLQSMELRLIDKIEKDNDNYTAMAIYVNG